MAEEFFESPFCTRREMAADFHRPLYHFLPPRNWMNDPNGLVFWHGRYHLFYQFNPHGSHWGFIHWGHASSPDLIHWEDHPIALAPQQDTGDDLGCFSGCVVMDQETPTAVYTGFVDFFNTPVLMAQAQDSDLNRWKKSPHNPVIAEKPDEVNDTDFRDPYVWREGAVWKMVIGAGLRDGVPAVVLYQSEDLISWDYQGVLFQDQQFEDVTLWECPNFFKLGEYYVLLVSLFPNFQGVYYYVGDYDGEVFSPKQQGFIDSGSIFYAPQVRQMGDDRQLLFAWLLEGRSDEAIEAAGWAGVQALPRELSLDDELRLISCPVSEFAVLRQSCRMMSQVQLTVDAPIKAPIDGRQLEIWLELTAREGVCGLHVLVSPDGAELTRIGVDFDHHQFFIDTRQSSLSDQVQGSIQSANFPDTFAKNVFLHVFIDGSVIEVWLNDAFSITSRVYPTRKDALEVMLFTEGSEATVKSLKAWTLGHIWPDSKEAEDV